MVIPDSKVEILPRGFQNPDPSDGVFAFASPVDRFAAAVIDYFICLTPVLYVVLAPFQRIVREAALVDDDTRMSMTMLLAFVAVVAFIIGYQTICVWRWGATLGKALMGLRVHSMWGGPKVRLTQALNRACYWVGSFFAVGVPFIGVSANLNRRPLHDRAADTIVVAVAAGRGIGRPGRRESAVASAVYWAFATFCVLLIAAQVVTTIYDWKHQAGLIGSLEEKNILCHEVTEVQASWPAGKEEVQRLDVALSLYAASVIDRKCLQGEVEALFATDAQSSALYLAKSFVYIEHAILSDLYLEKVCEIDKNSPECRLTTVINLGSHGDWDAMVSELRALGEKQPPPYVAIWAIHQLLRREEFQLAESMLKWIPDAPAFSDFVVSARTKILWGLGHSHEAAGAELAAYSMLGDEVKLELSSFMCFEELSSDCAAVKNSSCQTMSGLARSVDDGFSGLKTSLAYLKKWECEHPRDKDYESLLPLPLHPDVRSLTAALMTEGSEGFLGLMDDPSLDEEFMSEVTRRLVERTDSERMLDKISGKWMLGRHTLAWQKTGATLFNKYYIRKDYRESLKVVEELEKASTSVPKGLLENALVAAVKGGLNTQAQTLLENYANIYPLPMGSGGREPASSSDFLDAVRTVRGKNR